MDQGWWWYIPLKFNILRSVEKTKLFAHPHQNAAQPNQMHDIGDPLCLATEIVTKNWFSLRRFRSKCNEADVQALCMISYCIRIRTSSSHNRIKTHQGCTSEVCMSSAQVCPQGLSLGHRFRRRPSPHPGGYSVRIVRGHSQAA